MLTMARSLHRRTPLTDGARPVGNNGMQHEFVLERRHRTTLVEPVREMVESHFTTAKRDHLVKQTGYRLFNYQRIGYRLGGGLKT